MAFVTWQAMSARGRGVEAGASYFAGALSLVFHPRNPYVPTFRSDIRYFVVCYSNFSPDHVLDTISSANRIVF